MDELLINFQKKNLFHSVVNNINSVLTALDCPPVNEESIIRALDSLEQKKLNGTNQRIIPLKQPSIANQNEEINTDRAISPLVRYFFGPFIVTLLIVTIVLDLSVLWLMSPVQKIQERILVHVKDREKNANTKVNTLKELDSIIPQGLFSYGGSTTWAPITKTVNPKIIKEYPEFNLRYLPTINGTPGSGTGIRMLIDTCGDYKKGL